MCHIHINLWAIWVDVSEIIQGFYLKKMSMFKLFVDNRLGVSV